MDNFQPKLNYIRKVMYSIEKLEQLQVAEEWAQRVLNKHPFKGQEGRNKGMIRLHRLSLEVSKHLEQKWMQNQ